MPAPQPSCCGAARFVSFALPGLFEITRATRHGHISVLAHKRENTEYPAIKKLRGAPPNPVLSVRLVLYEYFVLTAYSCTAVQYQRLNLVFVQAQLNLTYLTFGNFNAQRLQHHWRTIAGYSCTHTHAACNCTHPFLQPTNV